MSVTILSIMLCAIMLSVIMLNVMVPNNSKQLCSGRSTLYRYSRKLQL
jgi:hypothetical protein